ncbi:GNAT family N-acetyltransferase [Alteromonas pelagimontana]|uniref:GNAT family N-acetyltransferase n=2 Tax=Alteromonas pelagimontana TaxID=1858656 RepID=A0A6M4MIF7_9ALTE|nr:GNAT family N-acetyltransferase [Alteromonas pelagimontana]
MAAMAPTVEVTEKIAVRTVQNEDIDALCDIEQKCFATDKLSKRRMRFYVTASHAEFVVATEQERILGYGLLLLRRGTQLTRLYSIAVVPEARGKGVAQSLVAELEKRALLRGKRFMRLEVSEDNSGAINLYQRLGFQQFGIYNEYYEDKSDAIRMQKVLSFPSVSEVVDVYPWYQQTTEFTCGPAALMMALAYLDKNYPMRQLSELEIWRRATTIFMTSGHGGCHPIGLALAANDAGFTAEVWVNRALPLFADGVRSQHKKDIISVVEDAFLQEATGKGVAVKHSEWKIEQVEEALLQGAAVLCLISTYAFDKQKAPHWVTVTAADERCFYIHDPDPTTFEDQAVEYQHIPVAREDFGRLASYGKRKVRTVVVIHPV